MQINQVIELNFLVVNYFWVHLTTSNVVLNCRKWY